MRSGRSSRQQQAEQERETAVEFLRLVNESQSTRDLVRAATGFFRQKSGCQAVGIRLRQEHDYPYYETRGFSGEFVQLENSLCFYDPKGRPILDSAGNPALECMCGNVICGRFDPSKSFFTKKGTYWTNCTTELLADTTQADRQGRIRNRCNREGYESVALLALRVGEERLGLLQLNDKRKDRFTPEVIALWERLADYLAVALSRFTAEEALRESEARYRLVTENISDVIWVLDLDVSRFLYVSPSVTQLRGYTPEEVLAEDMAAALTPGSRDHILDVLPRRLDEFRSGTVKAYVDQIEQPCKDGSTVWTETTTRYRRNETSGHIEVYGTSRDITERKQAEASQALLADILKVLNRDDDMHALVAETLRLVRQAAGFDAVGLRLRRGEDYPYFEHDGFSEEFLREENFLCERGGDGAILRGADGGVVLECTCGLVLSGRIDPTMSCFTEGGSFWTNVSEELLALPREADPRTNPRNRCIHIGYQSVGLFPVQAGGEIIGLLQLNGQRVGQFTPALISFYEALAQNIGLALQRVTAQEALRDSEQRLRLLGDNLPDSAVYQYVHEADGSVRFLHFSAGIERLNGVSVEDVLRDAGTLHRQIPPEYFDRLSEAEARSARGLSDFDMEVPMRRPDGQLRWMRLHSRPRRLASGGVLWDGVQIDVTERIQAEQQLKELNATLEERVAERTAEAEHRAEQLRALAAQLSQAEQKERQRLATILHDHLQQLLVGTKFHLGILRSQLQAPQQREMLKQVDNLLDESIDASRSLTVDLSPPILQHGTMAQVFQWLAQWFGGKQGLSVEVQADARANSQVSEVRTLLFQAVRELLFNVVKHAKVNRARVELSCAGGGRIQVVIRDAGTGFDPSRPRSSEGSGFGLFSIRERLDWLGGTFEIESAPGKGTRATIVAPMRPKTILTEPTAMEPAVLVQRRSSRHEQEGGGGS